VESNLARRIIIDASLAAALVAALAGVSRLERQFPPASTPGSRPVLTPRPSPDSSSLLTPNRLASGVPAPAQAVVVASAKTKPKESPPAGAPSAPEAPEGLVAGEKPEGRPPEGALTLGLKPAEDRDRPATKSQAPPASLYTARTEERREQWIGQLGGNERSEAAVSAGLEWLARHQAWDGSWSNQYLSPPPQGVCEREKPCQGPGQDFAFAQTGLALLALQASGHYAFNHRSYSDHVRRGLDYLAAHQGAAGGLYQDADALDLISSRPDEAKGKTRRGRSPRVCKGTAPMGPTPQPLMMEFQDRPSPRFMYEHGIDTFALAEACAVACAAQQEPGLRYLTAVRKAVGFIERTQHRDGGWRYTLNPSERSDTSVTGWQVLALKAAREAGIPLDDDCIRNLRRFFRDHEVGQAGRTGYVDRFGGTDATTGVGVLAHVFLLGDPGCDLVHQAIHYLAGQAESRWGLGASGRDPALLPVPLTLEAFTYNYYDWYNCTLALYMADGPSGPHWQRWNGIVRDRVIGLQRPADSGCERGSWPCLGADSAVGGRVYSTALGVLTLEVYYRYGTPKKD
jgi:hypothetical protein